MSSAPISDDEYGAHPVRPVPPDYSRGETNSPEYMPSGVGGVQGWIRMLEREIVRLRAENESLKQAQYERTER